TDAGEGIGVGLPFLGLYFLDLYFETGDLKYLRVGLAIWSSPRGGGLAVAFSAGSAPAFRAYGIVEHLGVIEDQGIEDLVKLFYDAIPGAGPGALDRLTQVEALGDVQVVKPR